MRQVVRSRCRYLHPAGGFGRHTHCIPLRTPTTYRKERCRGYQALGSSCVRNNDRNMVTTRVGSGTGAASLRVRRQRRAGNKRRKQLQAYSDSESRDENTDPQMHQSSGFVPCGDSEPVEPGMCDHCTANFRPPVALPIWERLQPRERKLVYVSPDKREGHFLVAAHKTTRYHTSPRDFAFVGFRFVQCRGGTVLVGWCSADRDCSERSYRREMFPDMDFPHMDPAEMENESKLCPCAAKLLRSLGGEDGLKAKVVMDPPEAREQWEESEALVGHWELQRQKYSCINPGDQSGSVFGQWGVVRQVKDGFLCSSCQGTPRQCMHTQVLLNAESALRTPIALPPEEMERRIKRALDPCTGKFRVGAVSRFPLPFFPEDDTEVLEKLKGRRPAHRMHSA